MSTSFRHRRLVRWVALSCGCLLAGPCGITSLQLQDFVVSTTIRTLVSTVTAAVEAALVEAGSIAP
jgi:hypothetical protein